MVNPSIFREYDIRGVVDQDLTPEVLYLIGRGYGTYIKRKGAKNCAIGGDARLSTPEFKKEFTRGMLECGLDVIDVGIVATPVLYFSIWKLNTNGGVVITASHNPAEYNGIKMNLGLGSVFGEEIQEILHLIQNKDFDEGNGIRTEDDTLSDTYINYIVDNLHISRPVKVAVDGGNGTGGPYLPEILRRCGCEVFEIYCDMDGTFPNHHPDPTVEKNMKDLQNLVIDEHIEIGLGLDGDADRIGVIDEKGKMLYGDQILNIIVRDFLKDNKGEKIIADVKCSKNLFDDIKKQGGIPIMYKTGHANIKMKMRQEGIKVSGEMSGHIFLKDRYLGYDDAIYVGARLVEITANSKLPVSEMLADQPVMYNTPELHIQSTDDDKFKIVEKVRDSFIAEGYDVNAIDGMRVTFKDGWALCRASNTTPVLVLRFEAETQDGLKEIQQLVEARVKKFI